MWRGRSDSADGVLVDGVTDQVDGETSLAYLTTCRSRLSLSFLDQAGSSGFGSVAAGVSPHYF